MSILEVVLLCVVGAGVAAVVAMWLFKKDEELEDARRAATEVCGVLNSLGCKRTAAFVMDWVVRDYSSMCKKVVDLARLLTSSPDAVAGEFGKVFEGVLDAKLLTDSGRAYVAAKLQDACKKSDPSVVQDAPRATVG
jgi:hypothetical protein